MISWACSDPARLIAWRMEMMSRGETLRRLSADTRSDTRVPAGILTAAAADSAWVELIADGVHVDGGFTRLVFAAAAPGRVVLVTDAMAAAGMPDGTYSLGPLRVTVSGGVARLTGTDDPGAGTIAGGTRTLLEVVATAVASGVPVADAVRAASEAPARVLGLSSRGALSPGLIADLVVTDPELRVRRVMRAGRWLG